MTNEEKDVIITLLSSGGLYVDSTQKEDAERKDDSASHGWKIIRRGTKIYIVLDN